MCEERNYCILFSLEYNDTDHSAEPLAQNHEPVGKCAESEEVGEVTRTDCCLLFSALNYRAAFGPDFPNVGFIAIKPNTIY